MRKTALHLALAAALPAAAVTLNPDGTGQALIYPYYTAQSTGSDAFNTYISVVNHAADAKAVRLRFREGRMGKPALDLNVYLSPNDVWTGAVVPFSTGTRLISTDTSCTEPRFAVTVAPGEPPFIDFRNDAFAGANDDGAGTGLDRTREGFVEIIEMATLTGASAAAVTHVNAGAPSNCGAVAGWSPSVAAPSGGLSGTLTLINVASGMDFTVNAEALDQLASKPYYRGPSDSYPGFNATEIDAVSVVDANGATYRSIWSNPIDAVSAVLMRERAVMEYILDPITASLTDAVMTLPTRHFYATPSSATGPFTAKAQWSANCATSAPARFGEELAVTYWNRDERSTGTGGVDFPEPPPKPPRASVCASAAVSTVRNASLTQMPPREATATPVLGSVTGGLVGESVVSGAAIFVPASTTFVNGWLELRLPATSTIASLPASSRIDHRTGAQLAGAHTFTGLPIVGFSARIFRNGTLRCDAGSCQGNYGGAFPFKYRRNISPTP